MDSLTDEQRRRCAKDRPPFGRSYGGRLAALLQSSRTRGMATLLPRALPVARRNLAQPFPIYEMGS
ncbi:MAG: hypothetical protein ACREIF_12730, partial [Chthoniobacterales bacterium]